MDGRQIKSILIALLLPALARFGLSIAVGFGSYLRRDKKRALHGKLRDEPLAKPSSAA